LATVGAGLNRDQLIRELRHYARKNRLFFEVDEGRGKGSHYIVTLGSLKTTVQSDVSPAIARRIRKQLGVEPSN
jgi:hypothetical protein